MATRPQPRSALDTAPPEFQTAVTQLRAARLRPEVFCEEIAAPQRIAPFACAIRGEVRVPGSDVDLGGGRLVLLHDPAGNDAWDGTFRCVTYVRSEVDEEIANDPCAREVAWSWLMESLTNEAAEFRAPSGTVTSVATTGFAGMANDPATMQLEIRASWTPLGDLADHLRAWSEVLCTASGLPPLPDGVTSLQSRRLGRGE